MNDELKYLHDAIMGQLKETATSMFNRFSNAYPLFDKDLVKAESEFNEILYQGEYIVKALPFYDDRFIEIDRTEDLFYIIQVLSLLIKTSHNLWVLARHNMEEDKKQLFFFKRAMYRGKLYFYYYLTYSYEIKEQVREVIEAFKKEVEFTDLDLAIGNMYTLEFYLRNRLFSKYLLNPVSKEYKHFFTAYKRMNDLNNDELNEVRDSLASYLLNNIKDNNIEKLLYQSIFFESLLLDYCYKNGLTDIAHKIISNGYDRYLEIDTLYILYHYDRKKYEYIINELKVICLERLISKADIDGRDHLIVEDIFEKEFLSDLASRCKSALNSVDQSDETDPRNNKDRNTPEKYK